jgi:hypothetical protein
MTARIRPSRRFKEMIVKRFSVRMHMFVILTAVITFGLVLSKILLLFGLTNLVYRYTAVLFVSYGFFFIAIRIWLFYVLPSFRKKDASSGTSLDGDVLTAISIPAPGDSGDSISFEGIGGKFGGGGASGSWNAGSTPAVVALNDSSVQGAAGSVSSSSFSSGASSSASGSSASSGTGFSLGDLENFPEDPVFTSQFAYSYFRIDMKLWEKLSRDSLNLVSPEERRTLHVYQLPLRGNIIKVHQGNNETISHLGLINGYHFDFVMTDGEGKYGKDETKKEGHYIFDQIVYAAADGVVYSVYDSSPDTEPMKNNSGYDSNIIVISHPDNEYSLYIHIKCKSALVKPGDIVKRGHPIAHVGSSGRFTDIPHLHFGINRNGFSV